MPELDVAAPTAPGHRAEHDGWADVLATMERAIAESDNPASHSAHTAWLPPADLGVLPTMFRSRADRVLRAQQRAIAALEEQMLVTGRHLAALGAIPSETSSRPPAYLDVTG